jgi:hypothetical protein
MAPFTTTATSKKQIPAEAFKTAFAEGGSRLLLVKAVSKVSSSSFVPLISDLWNELVDSESPDVASLTHENEMINGQEAATAAELARLKKKTHRSVPMIPATPFNDENPATSRGYSSFILQKDEKALAKFFKIPKMPFKGVLPLEETKGDGSFKVVQTPVSWVFVGRNPAKAVSKSTKKGAASKKRKAADKADEDAPTDLEGRPSHTDSVSHDFTWHSQLEGSKVWHFRPTSNLVSGASPETLEVMSDDVEEAGFDLLVEEGDVLLVDTTNWWHCTSTPVQSKKGDDDDYDWGGCISYARDVYLNEKADEYEAGELKERSTTKGGGGMTNLDGLFAPKNVEEGTVIFTEKTFPNGELYRSEDPNCEVVELPGDEGMAVVSLRDVKEGEFYSIAESSDEEEEDYEEGDWEEEEEEAEEEVKPTKGKKSAKR